MDLSYQFSVILLLCSIFIYPGEGQYSRFDLLHNESRILSIEEFVHKYVRKNGEQLNFTTVSQSPDGSTDKIVVNGGAEEDFAPPDGCAPRMTSVQVPPDEDMLVVLYPECTRALRCSGCVAQASKSCQPVRTVPKRVNVVKVRLTHPNADHFEWVDSPTVVIEDEVECSEQCIIKPSDCTHRQRYYIHNCACGCEETQECDSANNQRWNERWCRCECIDELTCTGNSLFNRETCRCEMRDAVGGISEEEIDEYNKIMLINRTTTTSTSSTTSTTTTPTPEPTTTTSTPEPTTTSTTTTQAPHVVVDCTQIDCGIGWIGYKTDAGICDCMPDFGGFGFELRRRRNARRRKILN